jgi:hypothetical protein
MQSVSSAYLTAISANVRKIVQAVTIAFIDNRSIGATITVTASEGDVAAASKDSVRDGKDTIVLNYALGDPYDETDSLGRARMLPGDTLYPCEDNIAWFGATVSNDSNVISGGEALVLTYAAGVTINYVRWASNSFLGRPVDFLVEYWDGSNWQTIQSVTAWAAASWSKVLPAPITTTKLRITVTKVNLPQTSVKLIEFEGSLTLDATGLVKDWEIIKERSADSQTEPLGNASSNQVTLELDNTGSLFYRHGSSIYAPYLAANRRVTLQCGVVLAGGGSELVPVGAFYTVTWNAELTSPTVRIVAWDRSKLMKETDFASSLVYVNYTISDLVKMLCLAFGLAYSEVVIDETTDVIPYAWFDKDTYWNHLAALAEAEGGQVYFDELDRLVFENRSHLADHETLLVDTLSENTTIIDVQEGWDQSRMRNDIRVTPTALQPDVEQNICHLTDVLTVPAGGDLPLTIYFSKSPCINVQTPVVSGGSHVTVSGWTAYAWGGDLTLHNSGGADESVTAITADGQPLIASGGIEGAATDDTLITLNGRRTYALQSRLIQSQAHAQALADDLLPVLKDPGAMITVDSRGRPELQLADALALLVTKMGMSNYTNPYQITRSQMTFDGALAAKLTLLEVK